MDESIVSSAKTIVARKLRESGAMYNTEEKGGGGAVPSQLQQLEKVLFAQAIASTWSKTTRIGRLSISWP